MRSDLSDFPVLNRSFKKRFAFRLSVPSFIYPAGYAANVRRLALFVDEVELLLFEGRPARSEIRELSDLAERFDVAYNVHLPLDLHLGASDRLRRDNDTRRLLDIFECMQPLRPTTWTLHLNLQQPDPPTTALLEWQKRWVACLDTILHTTRIAPGRLSIENLDYPLEWFTPIIDQLELAVCLDIGHVLRYGMALEAILSKFGRRVAIVHLHGADFGRDHLALDHLNRRTADVVISFLKAFSGTVSLEVFSFDRLQKSIDILDHWMA